MVDILLVSTVNDAEFGTAVDRCGVGRCSRSTAARELDCSGGEGAGEQRPSSGLVAISPSNIDDMR
jgi:hypothetical protein